jgi:DNA-binding NarL/FixJ family response regulator
MAVVPRTRCLLTGRHPVVLAALGSLLSSPPVCADVLIATRSSDAIEIVKQGCVDLVLCDMKAEPIGGGELPAILAAEPTIRIILLADVEDERMLLASLQSGAMGFFTKDTPVEEFLEGVEAVLNGQYVVGRNLVHQTLAKLNGRRDNDPRDGVARLSPSERAILALIGQAQSVRSIAVAQGITQKTVRNHLASIYRKLALRNRAEAILWVARMGWA